MNENGILSIIISCVGGVGGIFSAIIAYLSRKDAKKAEENALETVKNQKYVELFGEYRKVEMFSAIRRLHNLKHTCESGKLGIKEEYERIKEEEDKNTERTEYSKKLDFQKNTLHYQRRLVSQFYISIGIALERKLLPEEPTIESWTDLDILQIILEIGHDPKKYLRSLYEKGERLRKKTEKKKDI